MSGFQPVKIERRIEWSPGLITIVLDTVVKDLVPGQYVQLALQAGQQLIKRSYSASSAPGEKLEIFLSEVKEGALTPGLFSLKEGDTLMVNPAPLGYFVLNEVPDAQVLWMIATGTGLGPFVSMLRQGEAQRRFPRICLVHGVRQADHLAYRDELAGHERTGGVKVVPFVSRQEPPEGAFRGRLTDALRAGELEKAAGFPVDASGHYMLCGNPHMIEEMASLLKERGLSKHRRRKAGHFTYEKYW